MGDILVTGSNGFIGSAVVEQLLAAGKRVVGVSRLEKSSIQHRNFVYVSADISDISAITSIFDQFDIDVVIHLAAIAHVRSTESITWDQYYHINFLGSRNVFQCASKVGAKILFSSTVDVYGITKDSILDENYHCEPISDYAKTKYMAETDLTKLAKECGLQYVIFRLAPVYSQNTMTDVYKRIYIKPHNIAYLIGFRGREFHLCSLRNVTDSIVNWIQIKKPINGIINVTDERPISAKVIITGERKIGRAKLVIVIPKTFLLIISKVSRFAKNTYAARLHSNLYKLLSPPTYSVENYVATFGVPKWNVVNTVYSDSKGG